MNDDVIFILVTLGVFVFFGLIFFFANLHDTVRKFRRKHTKDEWYFNFNNLLEQRNNLLEERWQRRYKYSKKIKELSEVVLYETEEVIQQKREEVLVITAEIEKLDALLSDVEFKLEEERKNEKKYTYFF